MNRSQTPYALILCGCFGWLLSLQSGCVATPMQTRPRSAGNVRVLDGSPTPATVVEVRTSPAFRGLCASNVIDREETTTDADGRWRMPSAYRFSFVWLIGEPWAGYCRRYALPQQPDVPPLQQPEAVTISQGRRFQLSVREAAYEPSFFRLIAGVSGSTDQLVAAHVGALFIFERRWVGLGLRAAVQPGILGGAAELGLRVGLNVSVDASLRVLRVWQHGHEGLRIGPEIGVELVFVRIYGGAMSAVQGALDGEALEPFIAIGVNLLL